MRYPANRKEESRQKILQAAARLFREHGYNGVGVDAVMAEAGLTPGGFYAHFPSKEALFAEALASSFKAR
ncbi:MAG TPA: helix-turn-helix domain-containing protein, partial [Acidobacteriota bacterium]|nr:helix-turn-helix domain-containing protein [Acidobacteriota bacterium]